FGAPDGPRSSPDRVDALVWAVSALLLKSAGTPRLRAL
ncbi:MAG TPA: large terminase, partial [Alphaproteobacteria bacterium]|nr:large terminase [Alphaproteobacteria bacterium]